MEFEKYYSGSATTAAEQQSPSALERLKALFNERVEIRWDQKWYPGMLLAVRWTERSHSTTNVLISINQ
jgi:hypothetical protein